MLESNRAAAERHLDDALAAVREPWEPKTTARNLDLIRQARAGLTGVGMDCVDWRRTQDPLSPLGERGAKHQGIGY